MSDEADRRRTDPDPKQRKGDRALSDLAFERWFRHQVHRIYDQTMAEPIPDQLTELLERFPSQRDATAETEAETNENGDDRG